MALACIAMYAMALLHWARIIHDYVINTESVLFLEEAALDCISNVTGIQTRPCALTVEDVDELAKSTESYCMETYELLVIVRFAMLPSHRAWI